jgi:GDP-D-mannose dehydratase
MEDKNISAGTRLSMHIAQRLASDYQTRSKGIRIAVDGFVFMKERTALELRNKFTPEELKFLLYYAKKAKRERLYLEKHAIASHVRDMVEGDKSVELADFESLTKKIIALTAAQVYFLFDRLFIAVEKNEPAENVVSDLMLKKSPIL